MSYVNNIVDNYTFLKNDFVGISVNYQGIWNFIQHFLLASIIFIIFYFLGDFLRKKFFKGNIKYNFFIAIALGYIVVGSGIGILGFFSLIQPQFIILYLLLLVLPILRSIQIKNIKYKLFFKNLFPKRDVITWGILLFIFITFLRLMTPEITEDGYHTDFPVLFISSHTSIHDIEDTQGVMPFPFLPEMIYTIPIAFGDKEAVRFIHFGFYLLIVFLLMEFAKEKKYSFSKFTPLLFVTSPVVIQYAPMQHTDFFAIFTIFLSLLMIDKNMSKKNIILSGIFWGATLAAKMWMIVYFPVVIGYMLFINKHLSIKKLLTMVFIFFISYLSIVSIWYIRSFVISGNPIYPLFNDTFESTRSSTYTNLKYLKLNWDMFSYQNMKALSPLFFLGIIAFIFNLKQNFNQIKKSILIVLFLLITIEQLFIAVAWGRYLLTWFIISSFLVSTGIVYIFTKKKIYQVGFLAVYLLVFFYFLTNILLTLPYGFGWADKNAYLTRVLGRDNISYYDFDHKFSKFISDEDIVGTYSIANFYYADFQHIDMGYLLKRKSETFDQIKKRGITKLMIKGGDFNWFCIKLELKDCGAQKIKLLATYPEEDKKYNLYLLQY